MDTLWDGQQTATKWWGDWKHDFHGGTGGGQSHTSFSFFLEGDAKLIDKEAGTDT